MTGNHEGVQMIHTRRMRVDSRRSAICRDSERTRQREQTCGKSDDFDTANMRKPPISRSESFRVTRPANAAIKLTVKSHD